MTSIILTIHNKEWMIRSVLDGLFKNTTNNCELILVFDGCTDRSYDVAMNFCLEHKPHNFSLKEIHASNVFETKANNLGMKLATGDTILIIQDDMVIKEKEWLCRMHKPFTYDDIFAVTSRTAHNWIHNPENRHENLKLDLDDCWCDILQHVDHANRGNTPRDVFAVRESVNRGPLLMRHDVIQKMNYFDEDYSPQDMDDHDLCYRTFKKLGLRAGLYWIDYESRDEWGGTRVSGKTANWMFKANHKNTKILWNRHKDIIISNRHIENRKLF